LLPIPSVKGYRNGAFVCATAIDQPQTRKKWRFDAWWREGSN
jgi:hypothetical protein